MPLREKSTIELTSKLKHTVNYGLKCLVLEHGDLCCATDFLDSLEQAQLILLLLTSWLFHLFSYSNCNFSFELEKDFEVFDYTWKRHMVEYVKLEEMHT